MLDIRAGGPKGSSIVTRVPPLADATPARHTRRSDLTDSTVRRVTNDRLPDLGKSIWRHVCEIQAFHVAARTGTPNMRAEAPRRIKEAEAALWGDLQTLYRGGVFPDELPDDVFDDRFEETTRGDQ